MYPFASVSHFVSGYPISWKYFESRDINNLMASQQRNYAFIIHFLQIRKITLRCSLQEGNQKK